MLRIAAATFAASLLVSTAALGNGVTVTAPDKVGMSADRLQRITDIFKEQIDKGQLPGIVLGIARKGQLVYYEALGHRDPVGSPTAPAATRRCTS
jgi:CubicO group peptidase (beta-lactamase class C family)